MTVSDRPFPLTEAGVIDERALTERVTAERAAEPTDQQPVGQPVLSPALLDLFDAAATEIRLAAQTIEAIRLQTNPALVRALLIGANRFLEEGGGKFSDAVVEAVKEGVRFPTD